MRELGNVADDAVAADVLADGKAELGSGVLERGRIDDVTQVNGADNFVRHFHADRGYLIGDRGNAHADNAERERQIARKVRKLAELHAGFELKIVARDRWPAGDLGHRGADAEAVERRFQPLAVERHLLPAVGRDPVPGFEESYRRILVFRHLLRLLDRLRDLVRGGIHILAAELFGLYKRHGLSDGLNADLGRTVLQRKILRRSRFLDKGFLLGRYSVLDERLFFGRSRVFDERVFLGRTAVLCAFFLAAADTVRYRCHIRLSLIKDALRHIRDRFFRQGFVLDGDVDRRFLPAAGEDAAGVSLLRLCRSICRFRHGKDLRSGKLLCALARRTAFLFRTGLFRNGLRHRFVLRTRAILHILHSLAERDLSRNTDNAEERNDEHRQRAVYAHGPLKEDGQQSRNDAAGLQIYAAVVQAADGKPVKPVIGLAYEQMDRRAKEQRDEGKRHNPPGYRASAVEAENGRRPEEAQRHDKKAPAEETLENIQAQPVDQPVIPYEIADQSKEAKGQTHDRTDLAADRFSGFFLRGRILFCSGRGS